MASKPQHNSKDVPPDMRRAVFARDAYRCQDCGSMQNLHLHHLQLRSHGGEHQETNLITLCFECHARRHGT